MTKLPMVFVGAALLGVEGVIAARAVSAIITAVICLHLTRRLIGTPVLHQLFAAWRTACGALALVGVILALRPLLVDQTGLMLAMSIAIVSALGLAGYIATLALLWHFSGRPEGLERTVYDRVLSPLLGRIASVRR